MKKQLLMLVVSAVLVAQSVPAADDAANEQAATLGQAGKTSSGVNQHPDAQWFPNAGLGLFIHWGIAAIQAKGDLSWCMLANKSWYDATIPPDDYYGSIKQWHPEKMDYDRMLAAAKAAGFTYAVMVTKHHDGFTFWPSAFGDIGTKHSFNGRDFVKEYVDACRKHGLKVGLYYSPPDWWFDRHYRSWAMSGPALGMDHQPVTLSKKPADHDRKRADLVRGQVTELLTKYGKIDLLWFDGGKGEIANVEVRRLQPGIIINRRNGGRGDYSDSEGVLPAKRFSGWFEACVTCWPMRKWSYTEAYGFNDAPFTLTSLVLLRAWGGNLLANVAPKGDGSVPEPALACWDEMAQWMTHSRESVEGTRPGPWPGDVNLPVTTRPGTAYIHFLPELPEALPHLPPGEKKFTKTKQILPCLPACSDTAVWKNAPEPARVLLLRTGEAIPFTYAGGTLTVTPTPAQRTKSVDVVKVVWR